MPVVACPKCKTKFKLSTEQLGKAVRCNSCQAKFRTAAPKAAGEGRSAKTKAKAKSTKAKSKSASAKPAKKAPKTLEDELFSSAPLKPGAPDPLGNFVLEDPGFGELELPDPEDDGGGDSDDNMFADRAHLMNNPALKGRNSSPSGSGAKSADARKMRERLLTHEEVVKCLGFLHLLIGGLTILSCIFGVGLEMSKTPEDPEEAAAPFWLMAIVLGSMLIFPIAGIFVGLALFKLKNWAKIAASILMFPFLFAIPVGTAMTGYFLWILHNEKGKEVFSEKYRRAVAATPDIKAGRRLMIIVGAVVVLVFLVSIGLAVFFAMSAG